MPPSTTSDPAGDSGTKSPPTRRTIAVLSALARTPRGRTSAELARECGITTSTCALVLAELEVDGWVARHDDRRYTLGSGLFGLVHGLRRQFPLLDRGRDALTFLNTRLAAGCSMSRIDDRRLTTVDTVGHGTDGEHAVGQRFPIDPPFGLVAMAWRDETTIDSWLREVSPRLDHTDISRYRCVLSAIRERGYGAWRFDEAHAPLHDRLSSILASIEPTDRVARRLSTLLTMVTLQSVTHSMETDLPVAEFVVLPIFGPDNQPEYQIEIHLGGRTALSLSELESALSHAQALLAPTAGLN
ncbi:DNA-binding IclR family transcriptional regulator [Mycobacterium sp. MAA66]|uniref:MarR family transcriptional regulator n=1 Tax=Mycobacterium sp. MAA66 TaxID=3156297 RepID=UPI003516A76F